MTRRRRASSGDAPGPNERGAGGSARPGARDLSAAAGGQRAGHRAARRRRRKSPVPVTVRADGVTRYPQSVESAVYFSCLEALNNVAKYAEAQHVTITLARRDGSLAFDVTDDGRGFDTGATAHGSGLQGIADRLDALGGTLRVESAAGEGTSLHGTVPEPPTAR